MKLSKRIKCLVYLLYAYIIFITVSWGCGLHPKCGPNCSGFRETRRRIAWRITCRCVCVESWCRRHHWSLRVESFPVGPFMNARMCRWWNGFVFVEITRFDCPICPSTLIFRRDSVKIAYGEHVWNKTRFRVSRAAELCGRRVHLISALLCDEVNAPEEYSPCPWWTNRTQCPSKNKLHCVRISHFPSSPPTEQGNKVHAIAVFECVDVVNGCSSGGRRRRSFIQIQWGGTHTAMSYSKRRPAFYCLGLCSLMSLVVFSWGRSSYGR